MRHVAAQLVSQGLRVVRVHLHITLSPRCRRKSFELMACALGPLTDSGYARSRGLRIGAGSNSPKDAR